MSTSPSNGLYRVPREFFCPISRQFMKEPVIDPSTQQTCDRQSLLNNNNNINGHEKLNADHDLREKITEWRRKHTLAPTFAFISTPAQLAAAVSSLLNPKQIQQMKDSDLLERLRELKSAIQYKSSVIVSKDGILTLCRLIAGCPFPTCDEFLVEWVKISVGILRHAHFFQQINFDPIHTEMLTLIENACPKITDDPAFQSGLVNLIYSIWSSNNKETITSCHSIIQSLTSNFLSPHSNDPTDFSKMRFDKLFLIITDLSGSDDACRNPSFVRALVSLVWPMPGNLSEGQYLLLLETISSNLRAQQESSSTLEAMTRAGLVSQIFFVLEYTTPEEGEIEDKQILQRSFEILYSLSLSRIGRVEIVRVLRASGYIYLDCFSSAISANLEDNEAIDILPVLGILLNILENSRYTPIVEKIPDLVRLPSHLDPEVRELTRRILYCYRKIKTGENRCRPPQY